MCTKIYLEKEEKKRTHLKEGLLVVVAVTRIAEGDKSTTVIRRV